MESHIRVNIEANYTALAGLKCSHYKVLIALTQRGDYIGRCFPSVERLAADCSLHIQTVRAALQVLEDEGYILTLRKNEIDSLTGQRLVNVYMVCPEFISLSEERYAEARKIWGGSESKPTINQQQNQHQLTYTNKPAPETNNNNHLPKKAKNPEEQGRNSEKGESLPNRGEISETDSQQREAPNSVADQKSSAIVKKYTNPDPLAFPLPDPMQEQLAERVRQFGIPLPMARGYIAGASYQAVVTAANQVDAAAKKQPIDNPGGFFRYLLEWRVLDERLPEVLATQDSEYDYSDWIES